MTDSFKVMNVIITIFHVLVFNFHIGHCKNTAVCIVKRDFLHLQRPFQPNLHFHHMLTLLLEAVCSTEADIHYRRDPSAIPTQSGMVVPVVFVIEMHTIYVLSDILLF